jgi:hypothetical protein
VRCSALFLMSSIMTTPYTPWGYSAGRATPPQEA